MAKTMICFGFAKLQIVPCATIKSERYIQEQVSNLYQAKLGEKPYKSYK